jgi:hypothetical protein
MTINRNLSFVIVQFEGTKLFWESGVEVTLLLVYHPSHDCLEIIAYDYNTQQEAPRIYLNYQNLLDALDELKTIESETIGLITPTTSRSVPSREDHTDSLLSNQFLLSRLDLHPDRQFQLFIRAEKDQHFDFILPEKPTKLVPLQTIFHPK